MRSSIPSYRPQIKARCGCWLNSPAKAWVNVRPWGVSKITGQAGGAPKTPSTAANTGSGFITIPPPPPYGSSSVMWWRSLAQSRMLCNCTSAIPRWLARCRMRRSNPWRVIVLLLLIGAAIYINEVVVPITPPLFIPTLTPTRNPESFINEADAVFKEGKWTQAIAAYEKAIAVDPDNPSIYLSQARAQIYTGKYQEAIESADRALVWNINKAQ